jgi:teichuronic acid biosynthesis glycosyltransferase TuaG
MISVSVVIPTYNRENTLLRAIASVLDQTVPVLEILVCDDGSTDESKSRVMALDNPGIRWIDCGRNGLPSVPRNIGVKNARGDYIAFLDSDDSWLPMKIERQLQALAASGKAAVSSNANRFIGGKNCGPYISYEKDHLGISDLTLANNAICSSVMVKKSLLEEVSFFPEDRKYKAIEDYALWLRLATKGAFAYIREPLVEYYDDPHTSVRAEYDPRRQHEIIFSGLVEWIGQNDIALKWADARRVLRAYYKCINGGKLTLANRIKCLIGRFPSKVA